VHRQDRAAGAGDAGWDALVEVLLGLGPVQERRSRYGDKPALVLNRREIAHHDGDGAVDLRLTAAGWKQLPPPLAADPAVHRDPARRDWVELRLAGPADVRRLRDLVALAYACNSGS
jgi:hypothetical protein